MSAASEATQILWALGRGDRSRADRLMELVYGELRGLARKYVGGWGPATPLQPTELVHEAFVKLVDHDKADWRSRSHFYAVAATAMRQILVDEARKRSRQRRGGDRPHLPLDEGQVLSLSRDEDILAVDEALDRLAREDPERARLVELRFFGGLTMDELAEATGQSKRTLHREWAVARAWLRRELG